MKFSKAVRRSYSEILLALLDFAALGHVLTVAFAFAVRYENKAPGTFSATVNVSSGSAAQR